jgi:poly(A) polymerase
VIDKAAEDRLRALLDDPAIAALLADIAAPGEQTRIVGGAIRNCLIGQAALDIDLATTLVPEAVAKAGRVAGWQVVPTGIEHGTVTLISKGHGVHEGRAFEITTLREDIATDGRRAEVRFGRDFKVDAARRDFTINALSMGADGIVHDYFGGAEDLAARRVRFIGDPAKRLAEDHLRSLRFLRFSAAYGTGRLDPAGFAAVIADRDGLATLSRERIRQEMMKLLDAEHALAVIEAAEAEGLATSILGLPADVAKLRARLALDTGHIAPLYRLNALAVRGADDVAHLRVAMRLTNQEERALLRLIEAQGVFRASGYAGFLELGERFPDVATEALALAALETGNAGLFARRGEVENPPVFHLTGKDVLSLGVAAGPGVGEALVRTKSAWFAAGCPAEEDAQRAILMDVIQR